MREALAPFEGQRITVQGIFQRTGGRPDWHGRIIRTVLISPLLFMDGTLVAEHLWFTYTASFAALDPRPGALIALDGRVTAYHHDRGQGANRQGQLDYRLSRPTNVRYAPRDTHVKPVVGPHAHDAVWSRVRECRRAAQEATDTLAALHLMLHPNDHAPHTEWYAAFLRTRGHVWVMQAAIEDLRALLRKALAPSARAEGTVPATTEGSTVS